jgi:hypothetical protein
VWAVASVVKIKDLKVQSQQGKVHHETSRQDGVADGGARPNRGSIYRMRTLVGARSGHTDANHINDSAVRRHYRRVRDAADHDI